MNKSWLCCAAFAATVAATSPGRADGYGPDFCAGYLKVWTNDTCQLIADTFEVGGPSAACVGRRHAYATFRKGFGFSIWLEMSNTCQRTVEVSTNVKKDDGSPDRYAFNIRPGEQVRESHFGFRNKRPFQFEVSAHPAPWADPR